jgi:hypothetical protein
MWSRMVAIAFGTVVAERREVVHAGKAHDFPPVVLFLAFLRLPSPHLFNAIFQQPTLEPVTEVFRRSRCLGHCLSFVDP